MTSDIVTLQVSGALKNIFAIKSVIDLAGEQDENARAMLVVAALKEIITLSKALRRMQEVVDILLEAGVVGDLVLTCYSLGSRNTKFGYELGISSDKKKFLQENKGLVEGREALKLVLDLIKNTIYICL